MYRDIEDKDEIDRLDEERLKLLVENRELKQKLERKKYKIQDLKGNLATALAQARLSIDDVERIRYEKEQQELRRAALQNFQLAPFIDLPKEEEESSNPFDDIGERIIMRDGKQIKQVKHIRGVNSNGEEIGFLSEWELTKQELKEIEKEEQEKRNAEAEKQLLEKQNRISEEEPSIPYNKNAERIISRNGKKFKQWFWVGSGTDIWYDEKEIVDDECSASASADDICKQAEKYVMSRLCSNREHHFMAMCDNQKSMPFCCDEDMGSIVRLDEEKELDEWIEEQEEKARLGFGHFDISGRLKLDPLY
jgi:hypothetical protein